MNKKTKQILLYSGLSLGGLIAYLLFKTKTIEFYDNVWCADFDCSNIDADNYKQNIQQKSEIEQTGFVNLIFTQPHNLEVGELVYVEQNVPYTYEEYNGWHRITRIVNNKIIELNIQRLGDTPIEGGTIKTKNYFKKVIE